VEATCQQQQQAEAACQRKVDRLVVLLRQQPQAQDQIDVYDSTRQQDEPLLLQQQKVVVHDSTRQQDKTLLLQQQQHDCTRQQDKQAAALLQQQESEHQQSIDLFQKQQRHITTQGAYRQ
jgi:hypothetical protein